MRDLFVTPSKAGLQCSGSLIGAQHTDSISNGIRANRALLQTKVLLAVVLIAGLAACGQSKPSGTEYLGNWSLTTTCWTGSESKCVFDISRNGESFVIKKVADECAQQCQGHEGIFTLTPEGNLKGGQLGMMVLSFDKAKSQIVFSGGGKMQYLSKTQ